MSNSIRNSGYDFDEFPDFNWEADLEDEELFPTAKPNTIVDGLDHMDISDPEYEAEEIINLVPTTPTLNLQSHSRPVDQVKEKVEYTLIPETGAFVTATCPQTGKNIYFSKLSEGRLRKKTNLLVKDLTSNKGSKGLLSKPLWQLLKDIKANNLAKTQQIQR